MGHVSMRLHGWFERLIKPCFGDQVIEALAKGRTDLAPVAFLPETLVA